MSLVQIKASAAHRKRSKAVERLRTFGKSFHKKTKDLEELETGWSEGGTRAISERLKASIQTDEYAASIPKAADIFSPPSSPRTRASRAKFVPSTPPKLRLPSAAELARSRPGRSKATTRAQAKDRSKQRQKKALKMIEIEDTEDEDVPRRPSGGGGKKPPGGPMRSRSVGPPKKKKKKKKKKKSSGDESDEKDPTRNVTLRRAQRRSFQSEEKKEEDDPLSVAARTKRRKTEARKKQAARMKQLRFRGRAKRALEPHVQQHLTRRAYLAIRKRQKAGLKLLKEGQDVKDQKRKTEEAFAKTFVGRRYSAQSQSEGAIARARLHKQQRAQFRKAKRQNRQHYAGLGMKEARLQIKEEGPGVFSVRSTGMSAKVQKHVQLLLNRIQGSITVNGQSMDKKKAYKVIIDILTKHLSAQVKIVQ